MDKLAIILCGGRGSRLGSITDNMPKPLVEVRGKPILWYTVMNLYHQGFRKFIFPLGYKGEMIRKYTEGLLCDLYEYPQRWFVDTGEDTPIASRIDQIKKHIPDHSDFFLVNGDTLFDFDIDEMYQKHKDENALVTLSSVEVVAPWGLIHVWDDRVTGFDRERKIRHVGGGYRGSPGVINSGLAWINKDALGLIDLDDCGDFETSLYQAVIAEDRCSHYEIKGMWYPIDTQKDLENINREMGREEDRFRVEDLFSGKVDWGKE